MQQKLTKTQYEVTQLKETEMPNSANYELFKQQENKNFTYYCTVCENPLFDPTLRFDAGCGWPAFADALPDSIKIVPDFSLERLRDEAVCAKCGAHLGHLFKNEHGEGSKRYCINAVSIGWKENDQLQRFNQNSEYEDCSVYK